MDLRFLPLLRFEEIVKQFSFGLIFRPFKNVEDSAGRLQPPLTSLYTLNNYFKTNSSLCVNLVVSILIPKTSKLEILYYTAVLLLEFLHNLSLKRVLSGALSSLLNAK